MDTKTARRRFIIFQLRPEILTENVIPLMLL
jgi:hypothetical protein